MPRVFIPAGEWKPDLGYFSNDGMFKAEALPISGGYSPPPAAETLAALAAGDITGFHIIAYPFAAVIGGFNTISQDYIAYVAINDGVNVHIYEVPGSTLVPADVSRAALYSGTFGEFGMRFASFGNTTIATNFVDEVQYRPEGAALFANMITSTFNPKSALVASIKNNLFLAALEVLAPYSSLSAGVKPYLVAWSQNDNVRAFGDRSTDPSFTGAGWNLIQNDGGELTAFVGGEFGMIQQANAYVKVEGPPYFFRTVVSGKGSVLPNAMVRVDNDIYVWASDGPGVLRNGEGPLIPLTTGRLQKTIQQDNETELGTSFVGVAPEQIHASVDTKNNLIIWSSFPRNLVYNYADDRWSFFYSYGLSAGVVAEFDIYGTSSAIPLINDYDLPYNIFAVGTLIGNNKLVRFTSNPTVTETFTSGLREYTMNMGWSAIQLDPNVSTRVLRVRPIYRLLEKTGPLNVRVEVKTYQHPYDYITIGARTESIDTDSYTAPTFENDLSDPNGWIPTPETAFGDFHRIDLKIYQRVFGTPIAITTMSELDGIEVEFVHGPERSA